MKSIRIVIADDHTLIAEAWAFLLTQTAAFDVVKIYNNTQTLIDEIDEVHPQIVLLDVNIPPISGLDAIRFLLSKSPNINIIGISMHDEVSFAKRMLENGAKAYVTKNSHQSEMFTAINEALAGRTYVCEEIRKKL
jgi:two-component system invasion response regulator UvrY